MTREQREHHAVSCQRNPWRTIKHSRLRDKLACVLRRMYATVNLERIAPHWATTLTESSGSKKLKIAHQDVVVTTFGGRRGGVAQHHDTEVCDNDGPRCSKHNRDTERAWRVRERERETKCGKQERGDRAGHGEADKLRAWMEGGDASKLGDET